MANKTDYRRLYVQMWRDREVRRWDARAKLLFVYLITNESTENCGAYQIMTEDMARETGIPEGEVIALLPALAPSVHWWPDTDYVFIPRLYTYQHGPVPNPNFRVSAIRSMCGLPPEVAAAVVAEYPELGVDPAAVKTSRSKGFPMDDSPAKPLIALDSPVGESDSPIKPSKALDSPIKPYQGLSSPIKPSRSIPTPSTIPNPNPRTPPEKARTQESAPTPIATARNSKQDFEKFLAAYPKIGNPLDAQGAWKQVMAAGDIPPIETVMATLEGHKSSTKWGENGGQYIPFAAKYIHDRRWNMKPINETPKPAPIPHPTPDIPKPGRAVY